MLSMIIDQANAAAESNGRFFNKTNRFAQNESANRFESRIRIVVITVIIIYYSSPFACNHYLFDCSLLNHLSVHPDTSCQLLFCVARKSFVDSVRTIIITLFFRKLTIHISLFRCTCRPSPRQIQ